MCAHPPLPLSPPPFPRLSLPPQLKWPDDGLWYLVEIVSVAPRSSKATVRYTSGEVEALDLDEVVRDGHMSLLSA